MTATKMEICELGVEWSKARKLWLLAVLSSLLIAGCGKSGSVTRLPVFGKITAADNSELNGSITFIPNEGTHGPAATTAVVHGEYHFSQQNGPTVGPHQVIVKRSIVQPRVPVSSSNQKSETEGVSPGGLKTEWKFNTDLTENVSKPHDFKLPP